MNPLKDILSIFRTKGLQSWHLFDGSSRSALKQWSFILFFGIISAMAAGWWTTERFSYWSKLENRVMEEGATMTIYNQKAFRDILEDYQRKVERSESILNNLTIAPVEEVISEEGLGEVGTTTATSTE